MPHSLHIAAAHVLRTFANKDEPVLLKGAEDPVRDVLLVAAEACVLLAEVEYERDHALRDAARLLTLVRQVDTVLQAQPLPADGGNWETFTLAQQVRAALEAGDAAGSDSAPVAPGCAGHRPPTTGADPATAAHHPYPSGGKRTAGPPPQPRQQGPQPRRRPRRRPGTLTATLVGGTIMLLDTPDPGMDPDPYAHDTEIRRLLATHLPLHPEGQLALLDAWLVAHQDHQRAARTAAAGSAHDPAFMLLRAVTDHLLELVIASSAELADRASSAQALVDHYRDLEATAALGARVTAAASDENDLGPRVMGWVVASRARHAAELAAQTSMDVDTAAGSG
jgi:hypothetical protein